MAQGWWVGFFSCTASVRTGLAPWTSGYIIGIFIRLFRDVLYPCRFRLTLPRRLQLLHSLRVLTTVMTLRSSVSSSSQRYRRFSPLACYNFLINTQSRLTARRSDTTAARLAEVGRRWCHFYKPRKAERVLRRKRRPPRKQKKKEEPQNAGRAAG